MIKKNLKVGRAADNDIVIQEPYVSKTHCQFFQDDKGCFYVQDLDTPNGTYVNGVRCNQITQLHSTDTVRIGNTTLPWQTYFDITETGEGYGSAMPVDNLLGMKELIKKDANTSNFSRIRECIERIAKKITEWRKH